MKVVHEQCEVSANCM